MPAREVSGPDEGFARFELDLEINAEPVVGRLRLPAGGASWDFIGWVALAAALEDAQRKAAERLTEARRTDPPESKA